MDLKEILERNKKAHHRLGMITKELHDTLADGHHNSLRASQVMEMMNASFEMLKESDVLHSYMDEEFDVAFLDIDMPQMNGIVLARKIRNLHPNTIIIFITNFIQYAPEGYEVGVFRYLMKNQISEKLCFYFELAVKEKLKRMRIVTIQINGEHIDIPISHILYIESNARIMTMHLIEDSRSMYQFYGNMSALEHKFEVSGFLRVHKSYLVNMKHIEIFQCKHLELRGGIRIPCSERKYSELKQKFLKWEAENKWNIY